VRRSESVRGWESERERGGGETSKVCEMARDR
jgi:hypothetical protein